MNFQTSFHFYYIHLIIPFGKFGLPYLGIRLHTAAARAALPKSYKRLLGLFVRVSEIHLTLTWSTGSLTCVCDHFTCRGLSTTTTSQHNLFGAEKTHKFFLCSRQGSNLGSLDLEPDALPTEPPCHPCTDLVSVEPRMP